jgi:hypothetical protein
MDAFDLMGHIYDRMDEISRDEDGMVLIYEDGFKKWPDLDMQEVERVGRSLATLFGITLFGITLDETEG